MAEPSCLAVLARPSCFGFLALLAILIGGGGLAGLVRL